MNLLIINNIEKNTVISLKGSIQGQIKKSSEMLKDFFISHFFDFFSHLPPFLLNLNTRNTIIIREVENLTHFKI